MTGNEANDEAARAEGCFFDEAAAERVRRFAFKTCRHSKGKREIVGKPFEFTPDCWENWVKPLFGWKRKDGTRRFRKTFKEVPKKNGKSTECGVLVSYMLTADREAAAEVYGVAKDRNQAGIVFHEAKMMMEKSPILASMVRIVDSKKTVHYDAGQAIYRCLSADAGSQEGLNPSAIIRDELHALKNRALFDVLEYAGAARSQPLMIDITTAGDDKESVCYELYAHAKKVASGERIDTEFLPYIREATEDDDPDDEKTWYKANPSLGITLTVDEFRASWKRAKQNPALWNNFLRYRLNQWIEQTSEWLDKSLWDLNAAPPIAPAEGVTWYGGLDMSSTTDLTAFVLWEPLSGSIVPFFWVPSEAFKTRERKNKYRIDQWANAGFMRVIPGAQIDPDVIFKDVVEIHKKFKVKVVGADPFNAVDLLLRLAKHGRVNVKSYRQGMLHLSPPMKRLEGLILSKQLRHGGHPVLRWNFSNIAVKTDESENIRPVKSACSDKIDGVVALLMAIGCQMEFVTNQSILESQSF